MILRAFKETDAGIICRWLRNEEELYKWSADRFNKYPLTARDIVENYAPQTEGGRFIPLTAVDECEKVIGHFIIRYPIENDNSTVRFGFVIVDPELRGKGYGKQMLLLGIGYVRENMPAHRIDLGVFAGNESAQHCYASVGFMEYSRRRCELPVGIWECIDMELFMNKAETQSR